jgi:aminopeptidase N
MWFGNLVTMKWWNDLWLNESFATFISHLCLAEAPGLKHYTTSWLIFNNDKGLAFGADQKSTTHPVMGEVKNTEVAETHFDEIVYEKGSSFLKQLFKFVGFDNFSKGIQKYFQIFKWENTEFNDFISQMVNSTGNLFLGELCDQFLKNAGLNEVTSSWEVTDDNKIKEFIIHQTPCLQAHPTLQYHLCDILFLYANGQTTVFSDVKIDATPTTSKVIFQGIPAPDAVVLNYNDWAYFKLSFDQKSINFLQNYLYNPTLNLDVVTRQMFFRSTFDSARDSKISGVQYLDIVTSLLPQETNQDVVNMPLFSYFFVTKNRSNR